MSLIKNVSPLRYPGGKTRALKILMTYINNRYPNKKTILSPFLGGGSLELSLQSNGYTIFANDLFYPLYIFWKIMKENPEELTKRIRTYLPVSKENFYEFRKKIEHEKDEMNIAVYYFIINRCSFNGSTFCGGFSDEASKKRLTESSIQRIQKVDMNNMNIHHSDYKDFLNIYIQNNDTIVYADPPYYISNYLYGRDGDLHCSFDHEELSNIIKQRKDWLLCYNDCPYIRELYKDCDIVEVCWSYCMNKTKKSSEILIFPK
jgi:DNA adenine methylase